MTTIGTSYPIYPPTGAFAWLKLAGAGPTTAQTYSINGVTFVFTESGVDLNGDVDGMTALINASTDAAITGKIVATSLPTASSEYVALTAIQEGEGGNAFALDEGTLANTTKSGALFTGGTNQAVKEIVTYQHVVDALDADENLLVLHTDFAQIMALAWVVSDAGILVTDDDAVLTISADPTNTGKKLISIAEGTLTWAAGDILFVEVTGYRQTTT